MIARRNTCNILQVGVCQHDKWMTASVQEHDDYRIRFPACRVALSSVMATALSASAELPAVLSNLQYYCTCLPGELKIQRTDR